MKKEMLKKMVALSVALSVIPCGMASAADITTQEEANNVGNVVDGQIITVEDSIVITKDTLEINNTKGFADGSSNVDDYDIAGISSSVYADGTSAKVDVFAKEQLTINSNGLYGIASGGLHDLNNATSVVNLGTEENKNGIVTINTPDGYGITTNGRNGTISKVNVYAEELTIKSGKGAIRAWRSDEGVSLGSETTPIDEVTLIGRDSETIRAFAGPVEIYGNDVTIDNTGVGKAIVATNVNVDIVANDELKIVGDIEAVSFQAGVGAEDVMVNINKDNDDAKVEMTGNIKAYKNGGTAISGVNLNLGAEGSYLKGYIKDDNQKSTLTMNDGTVWYVTADSNLNTLVSEGGMLSLSKDAEVEITNANSNTFGVAIDIDGTNVNDVSELFDLATDGAKERVTITNDSATESDGEIADYSITEATAENMAIRGDVTAIFDEDGNVTSTKTTLATDTLEVTGDVVADGVSLKKTSAQVATNKTDIDANKTNIAKNAGNIAQAQKDIVANTQAIRANSNAIAGLNQSVTRLDGRLDKVGAGAAALAALHPLDYDAENKLSFSAGVGNYAGETAGAVGAFYRPNEDVMFSLGGTAGNGENMVNMGVSFAIGKGSSGIAQLSKAELVAAVKDVKAENGELRHEVNNAKAENQKLQERIAKLEEMVMKLATK